MPWWPMAMPSVTVMVVNSRGVPPASLTPFLTDCACRLEGDVAGRRLIPAGGDADEGLVDLVLGQAHRVVVAAVRRAVGAHGDVAGRQPGFVPALGEHRRFLSWRRERAPGYTVRGENASTPGGARTGDWGPVRRADKREE